MPPSADDLPGRKPPGRQRRAAGRAEGKKRRRGEQPGKPGRGDALGRSLIAVITTLNEQVKILQGEVEAHFGRHPDAEIILSQPGLGMILGARVLAESGDDPSRYADGKARRNYAATSPVTRASGKRKTVTARFVRNDRLVDALNAQAFSALSASPGARAFYDQQRANGHGAPRSVMKVRGIRGPNCRDARVSVTITIENPTPTTVMTEPASDDRICRRRPASR
jgi:transposase